MEIIFQDAVSEDNSALERMFQLFAHDSSELSGRDVGDDGLYHGLNDIKDYTTKPNYKTHFIRIEDKLAGFVVIRFDKDINYLRHFFIIRKYRKKKIGLHSAVKVFDKYPGNWRVSTMDFNIPAIKFWERVLKSYTNNKFRVMRRKDNRGPQYEFYLQDK